MEISENLAEYYGLSALELEITVASFTPTKLVAGQLFVREGTVAAEIGFLNNGIMRAFFYDSDNDEITTGFYQPGTVVISLESFNNRVPSKENIIAVTDTELFTISYSNMQELYAAVPAWRQICKDVSDIKSSRSADRAVQFQTLTAAQRYEKFTQEYPEVFKYTALRHVASFLGMDIATLSRIRSR